MNREENNIIKRAKAPTPDFFRKIRNAGMVLTAAGGAIIAAPVAIPIAITAAAGYIIVAGGVLTAVSQVTVKGE